MTRLRTVHVNSKQNQSPGVLTETTQSPQLVDSGHFHLQNGLFITENLFFYSLCKLYFYILLHTHAMYSYLSSSLSHSVVNMPTFSL